ncbi:MAG: S41 family peptidase [Bacteroidota bacterium]
MSKTQFLSLTLLLICLQSCSLYHRVDPDKQLSQNEIAQDIGELTHYLQHAHFDLNWDGKEQDILQGLQTISSQALSTAELKTKLDAVLRQVDDGHTRIVTAREIHRAPKDKRKFTYLSLDEETAYLKIPHFSDRFQLAQILDELQTDQHNYQRLLIDLRGNPGGNVKHVQYFLRHFTSDSQAICIQQEIKCQKGYMGTVECLDYVLKKGYKKNGRYLTKKCKTKTSKQQKTFAKKYLLVDTKTASGAMLASYHLIENGYTSVGSQPTAIFNTFGNPRTYRLPNSNLWVNISTARVILNEQHNNRQNDQLYCDIQSTESTLGNILQTIQSQEKK